MTRLIKIVACLLVGAVALPSLASAQMTQPMSSGMSHKMSKKQMMMKKKKKMMMHKKMMKSGAM